MKLRFSILICACLGCIISLVAQTSAKLQPKWVGNVPEIEDNTFYFVEVHSDASSSLDGARTSVKQEIASCVERTDRVEVNEIFEDQSKQHYVNDDVTMQSQDSYQLKLSVAGVARPITSRRIDEYWKYTERGGVPALNYHALYAIERKDASADFSNISTTSSYGCRGLWRSAIVPGWGQFYKGSVLKGSLVLGGSAVLAAGIVYTECMRADYAKKILKTHKAENKRTYATRRDNFAMGRNICIGALSALYVYNLIDAIVAPGARRVVMAKQGKGGRSISWSPLIMDNASPGVVALMTF